MTPSTEPMQPRRRPPVDDTLRRWLVVSLVLVALLVGNSLYLLAVRLLGRVAARSLEDPTYLWMFLGHLALGLLLLLPFAWFAASHLARSRSHPNRQAARVGWALLGASLVALVSGVALIRLEGLWDLRHPTARLVVYLLHALAPLLAGALYLAHRRRGPAIRFGAGRRLALVGAAALLAVLAGRSLERAATGPPTTYFPSLAKSATGIIPAGVMMADDYCAQCHADTHASWRASAHRLSSFNNPFYRFAVLETRQMALARDGNLDASRWCAGCHDPVPLFAGRFDDPSFDDQRDPTAHAGLTCTACHAIQSIDSVRGNADFTIAEPVHYPFTFSDSRLLRFVNRQLVRSKPDFHKQTFLKPLHRSSELCASCHKVHLPPELNHYKWVRGQNHYDSFLLSGVSGHGAASFYYPEKATATCAGCHMPLRTSTDFGARDFALDGNLAVHDHQFPAANTALADVGDYPDWARERLWSFTKGAVRVDLFAVREGGTIDGALYAPLRPAVPTLVPGRSYLLEVVIRTVKLGHELTQGTADSNELWLELVVAGGDRILAASGLLDPADGNSLDPWAHRVNVYMLDREGRRIDRRNPQDIFVPLYNHQIPPGAADVVHYRLDLPADLATPDGTLEVATRLRYRKFDTTFVRHVYGPGTSNDLPILELAADSVVFPLAVGNGAAPERREGDPATAGTVAATNADSPIPEWQRFNDYGIGLLRKAGSAAKGELGAAELAFRRVEELGRPDGPLNLARVYLAQGTVGTAAVAALGRAATFDPPPPPWLLAWLRGQVNQQNGNLAAAADDYRAVLATRVPERGFDFSKDYRVAVALAGVLLDQASAARGAEATAERAAWVAEARTALEGALALEPELLAAHYLMVRVARAQDDDALAREHLAAVERYRPDDNARDAAVRAARQRDPAANEAAEAIVVYRLRPPPAAADPNRQTAADTAGQSASANPPATRSDPALPAASAGAGR